MRRPLAVAVVAALALALIACSSATSATSSTAAAPTPGRGRVVGTAAPAGQSGRGGALAAFAACMQAQGVAVATPTPGATPGFGGRRGPGAGGAPFGLDTSNPQVAAALQQCQSQLGGRRGAQGGSFGAAAREAMLACLQQHGVDVSAAATGTPSPGGRVGSFGLDTSNPQVAAALQACRPQAAPSGAAPGASATATATATPGT